MTALFITALVVMNGCLAHRCKEPTALGNMGIQVNSPSDDYAPVLRDTSTLLFTSNRIETEQTGLQELYSQKRPARLYLTMRLALAWDQASHYELLTGQNRSDMATVTFAPNSNRMDALAYVARCEGDMEKGGCDIFMISNGTDELLSPGPELNSSGWDGHPFVTADGSRLYFASDRPGGFGGTDIWYAEQDREGFWGAPINAGPSVNSDGDELSPFLDPATSALYFAASTTQENLDIFVLAKGESHRKALPPPYNSAAGEITPFIKGGKFYVASNREGGCGGYDLYVFSMTEEE